jgi:ATP-dependent protease ClpP protease subunit
MFKGLKTAGVLKASLEGTTPKADNVLESTAEPSAPEAPKEPPMRFGAIKIPLDTEPYPSVINISEIPNATNTNDYIVFINGGIRGSSCFYAELITLLDTLTEESTVVTYINSPGGSLYTGSMIASAMKNSKAKVITIARGVVASAAALIWSYGQERQVEDSSIILFHMSSHFDWGNSEAIRINADNTVRYVKEIAIDPMVEQGILTDQEAEDIIDRRRDVLIDAFEMRKRLEALNEE